MYRPTVQLNNSPIHLLIACCPKKNKIKTSSPETANTHIQPKRKACLDYSIGDTSVCF